MHRMILWVFGAFLLLSLGLSAAQIEGFVFDKSTGKPLARVNIIVKAKETGTVTDAHGHFIIMGALNETDSLIVSHIGFQKITISVDDLREGPKIFLEPVSIIMKGVKVEGVYQKYQMDTPVDIQIIDKGLIVERAPGNLGELLRMEPAIQVQSSSPGYQTVSIRGSNPEQVLVLYDGITIRSAADDIADISWIDVNDIGEVQVLKSGQSVMFGEGAIGGVLNLRSGFDSDYRMRFTARLGNYATKDAYVSLRKNFGRWQNQYSLSIKTANYIDDKLYDDISTASAFHNFRSTYTFSNTGNLTFRGMFMDRFLSVIHSLDETDDQRKIASLQYDGPFLGADHFLIQVLYRQYSTKYLNFVPYMPTRPQDRFEKTAIDDEVQGLKIEQTIKRNNLNISYGIQYLDALFESELTLDFIMPTSFEFIRDNRTLQRESVGAYNVMKYLTDTGSEIFPVLDWSWSLRYDYAYTERSFENPLIYYVDDKYDTDLYRALNYKIGLETRGKTANSSYRIFVNNGANVRFPSLYDIYLNDISKLTAYQDSSISPERVISSEFGTTWSHNIDRFGVFFNKMEAKLSIFSNHYISKIYYMPVIGALPVAINWGKDAVISGAELNFSTNIFADRLVLQMGGMVLNISDTWLFPNKPTTKYQADLSYNYKRLSCRFNGFFEGQQTGLARLPGGQTFFQDLSERADMNIYLNYRFVFSRLDILCGLTMTNVFSNENSGLIYSYLNRIRTLQLNLTVGIK